MANPISSVYLDGSSCEPLLPEAREAWLGAQESGWGDPLRVHRPGRLAAQALDRAREVVAAAVGARPDEVVFTASGSHSSQTGIAGLALGRRRIGDTIITSAVDHSSVLSAAAAYGSPHPVEVSSVGRVDLSRWRSEVSADGVAAACLQVANHEVGTIQPYREAAEICRSNSVPLVLDASSALGRLDLSDSGAWSVLTGSAAAFGGPASVGLLVIRRGVRWRAPYPVDDYQAARWPGLPDVPSIVAAAVALECWLAEGSAIAGRQRRLNEEIRHRIVETVPDVDVPGDPEMSVPHLLTFSVLYVDGETLSVELDRAGFAVASGSACSASSEQPSHVLAAMGALTHGNVRIGLTRTTDAQQVDAFLHALPPIVRRIRAMLDEP